MLISSSPLGPLCVAGSWEGGRDHRHEVGAAADRNRGRLLTTRGRARRDRSMSSGRASVRLRVEAECVAQARLDLRRRAEMVRPPDRGPSEGEIGRGLGFGEEHAEREVVERLILRGFEFGLVAGSNPVIPTKKYGVESTGSVQPFFLFGHFVARSWRGSQETPGTATTWAYPLARRFAGSGRSNCACIPSPHFLPVRYPGRAHAFL